MFVAGLRAMGVGTPALGFGAGRRRPQGRLAPHAGFTLLELLIVLSVIALIAAMAMVGLGRTRAYASETWAIHTLRTIHSAQDAFRASCGHGREYATSLDQLGEAGMISPDLVGKPDLPRRHYVIAVTGTAPGEALDSCTHKETAAHWYATATPEGEVSLLGLATADGEDIWQDSTGKVPQLPFTPSNTVFPVGR